MLQNTSSRREIARSYEVVAKLVVIIVGLLPGADASFSWRGRPCAAGDPASLAIDPAQIVEARATSQLHSLIVPGAE